MPLPYDPDAEYTPGGAGALASAADPEVTVPESGLSAVRAAIASRQTLRDEQQAFFDRIAKQLAGRRTGPSTSEQLFELSAALARPTTVRGFSGVLNNVMPVLQQQAKASRVDAEGRAEALTAMQLAQNKGALDLADTTVNTEVQLAKLLKGKTTPRPTWDSASQRYVSPEAPVPTNVTATTREGLRLTQYTDGTLRARNADGSMAVYDAEGNKMSTSPAGGQ